MGAALGGALAATPAATPSVSQASVGSDSFIAFFGDRQAGVQTDAQQHVVLLGIDLLHRDRDTLARLMRLISDDSSRLVYGSPALADTEPELAMNPARLSITVGWGPDIVRLLGHELPAMPKFSTDRLRPQWGQTDLLVQIGTDDMVSLSHAQRVLVKDLATLAKVTWTQRGFRDVAGAAGQSMRNLMGQVDGTVNPTTPQEFEDLVWSGNTTQVVVRRIEIARDRWDLVDRAGREFTIGRRLDNGAPLTGTRERDEPDFEATDAAGFPVIDAASHMRRARGNARGAQLLRRGYNYDDAEGAGLLFIAFAKDLQAQFVPMQRRLAELDLLNRWITTIGSAHYVVPPGAAQGSWIGADELG
jgi:dye decolorizing peroxidase